MRGVVAVCAVLSGCGANSALEIVVEMDPQLAVDRVQLYVGLGDAQNESGKPELLVPRDYTYPARPSGYYWKRDPFGTQDVVDVDPGAADVRFVFQEGTHDQVTAIVIGYRANTIVAAASLVDASLESGSVRQYHVRLAPATAAIPRPAASALTVHRWGPTHDDTRCAFLEDARGAEHSVYIVERDDRDCDGLVQQDTPDNVECRPDVFMGMVRPAREIASCVHADAIPTNPSSTTCVLGGPGCIDGKGRSACEPSATCAMAPACAACAQRADQLDCMASQPLVNTTTTRVDCTFFVKVDGSSSAVCPGPAMLAPKPPFLPACNAEEELWFWAAGQTKWVEKTFTKGGVTFMASRPTAACDIALAAQAGSSGVVGPIGALATVELANGRSAALPILINLVETGDCLGKTNICVVEGEAAAPSFLACLQSPVVEPW